MPPILGNRTFQCLRRPLHSPVIAPLFSSAFPRGDYHVESCLQFPCLPSSFTTEICVLKYILFSFVWFWTWRKWNSSLFPALLYLAFFNHNFIFDVHIDVCSYSLLIFIDIRFPIVGGHHGVLVCLLMDFEEISKNWLVNFVYPISASNEMVPWFSSFILFIRQSTLISSLILNILAFLSAYSSKLILNIISSLKSSLTFFPPSQCFAPEKLLPSNPLCRSVGILL